MASVATMSMMHEYMHKGTGEQRQPDQHAEDVGPVLGEQQRAGDDGKSDEYQRRARGQKAALRPFMFTMRMSCIDMLAPIRT